MSNERRNVIAQYMFQEQGYDETYAYKMADELLLLIDSSCPAGGGWIPVSERLPHIGEKVLLFASGVVQRDTYILDQGEDGPAYWDRDDLDEGVAVKDGDHWMPLPEPPEHDPHSIPPEDESEPPEPRTDDDGPAERAHRDDEARRNK